MITIFILIALAMTVPALTEGAEPKSIERGPAMTHEYEEHIYKEWTESELRAGKIDQLRHEVLKKKVWRERQAAREEFLAQKERNELEKAKALAEHLVKIRNARNNRAPAAEIMNDRYAYRKQKYERYIASVKDRRRYLREMRRFETTKERYERSSLNERIERLEKQNERD